MTDITISKDIMYRAVRFAVKNEISWLPENMKLKDIDTLKSLRWNLEKSDDITLHIKDTDKTCTECNLIFTPHSQVFSVRGNLKCTQCLIKYLFNTAQMPCDVNPMEFEE